LLVSLLNEIINSLNITKKQDSKGWYTVFCPFHDDKRKPNLRLNKKGFICMACNEKGNLKKLADKLGIESRKGKQIVRRVVATYDYHDENNQLLFQVVRYEPKNFKYRRPDGNGGWIWDLNGVRRVPYRLPELIAAPFDQWIFIVEGEKAADRLIQRGQIATCSPMGAGKWLQEYTTYFTGRKVVILPDNDGPGKSHAYHMASSISRVAKCVKVIDLPGLEGGQDVYDWLDS